MRTAERHADGVAIGSPVRRVEDPLLLTGRDRFSGDVSVDGLLHVCMVRSSHAHARLRSLDASHARGLPGVAAVFTGTDLGIRPVYLEATTAFIPEACRRPAIATDVVRFVGEIVAVVVADTREAAADAAAAIEMDYEPLQPVVGIRAGMSPDSPVLFPSIGSNLVVNIPFAAGAAGPAAVRVAMTNGNQRMAVAPMEPNVITAVPGPDGRLTVWAGTQMPHGLRDNIAANLGLEPDTLRVIAPSVGGGFGGKTPAVPEYVIAVAVARSLGRPVQFVETRSENLATMHGRDTIQEVVLEADLYGRLTSLHVRLLADGGAYPGIGCGLTMTTRSLCPGVYHLPHLAFDILCVATNTAPVGAYRGAGRPEATALIERAMDLLAHRTGLDPAELRRRNLVGRDEFPFTSVTGLVYDSGDYELCLDRALELSGYARLREEQRGRRERGDRVALGIGISLYVEVSAGLQMFWSDEASVRVLEDGSMEVTAGTSAHGQGHHTLYAQIVGSVLGVDHTAVRLIQADTDLVQAGAGTGGSRSAQIGGNAVKLAAEATLEKARQLASHLLEADPSDLEVIPGAGLAVRGVASSTLSWRALAAAAADPGRLPEGMEPGLFEQRTFLQENGTFPFGCHVAVVEVDLETGLVDLVDMVAVDDCGTVLNPLLAEGQVHGGVVAGIGQALFEEIKYDGDGNPVSANFGDYGMPTAADVPAVRTAHTVTPSPKNPLGAKGLGEAGTTGATAAVHNAVVDALSHLGVEHVELPLTPLRVWEALQRVSR
jgi:carbon-monoxide dehydrogenase large subunit